MSDWIVNKSNLIFVCWPLFLEKTEVMTEAERDTIPVYVLFAVAIAAILVLLLCVAMVIKVWVYKQIHFST